MDTYQKLWLMLYLISKLGNLAFGTWLYLERRNDKTNERIIELAAKVEKLDKDVASLEATAGNAPNHADLSRIYDSINDLARIVNKMVGENIGQSDTLRLILNRMMQGAAK